MTLRIARLMRLGAAVGAAGLLAGCYYPQGGAGYGYSAPAYDPGYQGADQAGYPVAPVIVGGGGWSGGGWSGGDHDWHGHPPDGGWDNHQRPPEGWHGEGHPPDHDEGRPPPGPGPGGYRPPPHGDGGYHGGGDHDAGRGDPGRPPHMPQDNHGGYGH
ncbi:MAG: hypothetical protein HIU92_10640 [Proteobacteria bacterium]|nr:hypothetical protein [Pseudomonadota bacterium]